jgi:hypothetical protein
MIALPHLPHTIIITAVDLGDPFKKIIVQNYPYVFS